MAGKSGIFLCCVFAALAQAQSGTDTSMMAEGPALAVASPMTYNVSFSPYTVMGPVVTNGSGYILLSYVPSIPAYNYSVYLYNTFGVKNVELHIAAPGTHGDVVAFLYASGSPDASLAANGLVTKGTIEGHDFVGPMLLPLAQHLDASFLQTRYALTGNLIAVVHTLGNLGGELAAQIPASPGAKPGMSPGAMPGMSSAPLAGGMKMDGMPGESMGSMSGMNMGGMSMTQAATAPARAPAALGPALATQSVTG